VILYVETTFIMGAAYGRDEDVDDLLRVPQERLRIALPAVCIMEAWSAFEDEQKRRHRFAEELALQISQLRRDRTSSLASSLLDHLELAFAENRELLDDVESRLEEMMMELAGAVPGYSSATLIPLTKVTLARSLTVADMNEPTDALILATILEHARRNRTEEKVLLSANTRDFGAPPVRALLSSAAVEHYFASPRAFLDWFQSRP
jgi:hypothetical protein